MSELINNRQKALKNLIKRLHEGADSETVKADFAKTFGSVSTEEISQLEQGLVDDGMDVEEIQKLCDVHADILGTNVASIHKSDDDNPGHPLNVLRDENRRIENLIDQEIMPYLDHDSNHNILMLRVGFDRLGEIEKHYTRKEQLFFPYLEKRGITTPPKVMWGVDDEIRVKIKAVIKQLSDPTYDFNDLKEAIIEATKQVKDMVFKENNILIPLLEEKLNLVNFIDIAEASDEIGYFLSKPVADFVIKNQEAVNDETNQVTSNTVRFSTGSLDVKTLNAMLNTLPFDMTFVDKEGYVQYFSQGKERIFDRPKTILGRHVNYCHPPSSVHIVEAIVNRFKSGEKDVEDFWIQMKDAFILIRYFAVRDESSNYLGTLEVTQNIAPMRALKGEKRLLDNDAS